MLLPVYIQSARVYSPGDNQLSLRRSIVGTYLPERAVPMGIVPVPSVEVIAEPDASPWRAFVSFGAAIPVMPDPAGLFTVAPEE